jgi:hypothetical protein
MGPHIPSSALLLALIGQAHAQPALDDATPCSVAVSAFSSADKERMQAVANFIENAFEQLDRRYTENGEAGILNERLRSALVGAAVGFCRQHQTRPSSSRRLMRIVECARSKRQRARKNKVAG